MMHQLFARGHLRRAATFIVALLLGACGGGSGSSSKLPPPVPLPISDHSSIVADLLRRRDAGEFAQFEQDIEFLILFRRLGWWHRTVTAQDALRQRVGFALSEIFVVCDTVDSLIVNPFALSRYYDTLRRRGSGGSNRAAGHRCRDR